MTFHTPLIDMLREVEDTVCLEGLCEGECECDVFTKTVVELLPAGLDTCERTCTAWMQVKFNWSMVTGLHKNPILRHSS